MDDDKIRHEITLAIFPFENLTEGNALDVFCKSFQMDLITELSRFRQFRILALDAGAANRIPEAADYTIKGFFRSTADKLKINAQLINNDNNHVAWADHFEGTRESLLFIQENLLKEVVSTLQLQLNHDLLRHIRKRSRVNVTAYEHWLYGIDELKKGTTEADEKARIHFQRAIEIDPNYSLAYSGMSLTYFNEWSCQLWDRWDVCQKGAYEWAKKAIELDEQNCVAACVLGRVYLYEGKYGIAEHYLRAALRLNPNDTDNLIQIASCFVFLGYVGDADELYRKVVQLSPLHTASHNSVGALIAFESGLYKECISLGTKAQTVWVDFPAVMAAAYYHLGDLDQMRASWQSFKAEFQNRITKGRNASDTEAVQWIINVNPYRKKTNLMPFLEFISGEKISLSSRVHSTTAEENHPNFFVKEQDRWQIAYDGNLVHLNEVKGFYDLAKLLGNPDQQFHCTELFGGGIVTATEPLFDERAKRSYQKRLSDLQEEIRWCEDNNDLQRTTSLLQEYDGIINHLSTSLGIGRKVRKANDPIDKVRSAVTWRIRNAMQKVSKAHPTLGKHLSASVKTGLFCAYRPEKPVKWLAEVPDPIGKEASLTM